MRHVLLMLALLIVLSACAGNGGSKPDVSVQGSWEVSHETRGKR